MNPNMANCSPQVEACAIEDLANCEAHWRELAARAGDRNPFAESPFLIAATRHIPSGGLAVLRVWSPGRARLDALAIIRPQRAPFGIVDIWRSDQAPLAALILDDETAIASMEALMDWLARERRKAVALGLPNVDMNGRLAEALRTVAAKHALRLEASNMRRRAALDCGPGANFAALLDAKRRKEWGRLRRRLADRGKLDFGWSHEPEAIEDFLALEAASWKAARRTALAADPQRAAFAREMLGGFASRGQLRIARLFLDQRTIAAGSVLLSGARAYYWKTAFDATFREFSPGVQLTLAMSRSLEADPSLSLVDSCAEPNHPMIDRLWYARINLADFVLATRSARNFAFSLAVFGRRAKGVSRDHLKRFVIGRRGGPEARAGRRRPE